LLEILLDINNCAQYLPEKRIRLSLKVEDPDFALAIDLDPSKIAPPEPGKAYKDLLRDVPHIKYAYAGDAFPTQLQDLQAGRDSPADPSQGLSHPPTFLTADDIDNYIFDVDREIAAQTLDRRGNGLVVEDLPDPWPTLAPNALALRSEIPASVTAANATRDAALRNPTSVYNWLRKHAPKTFLQDGEAGSGDKDRSKKEEENGHDDERHSTPAGRAAARVKGERGPRGTSARTQRRMAAAARAMENTIDFEDDMSLDVGTPEPSGVAKGKRKRTVDDDPGYRPKGGSSRPAKKKRKSEAGSVADGASTPTTATSARKLAPRKSGEGHARKPSGRALKAKDKEPEPDEDVDRGDHEEEEEIIMQDADEVEVE
jgi:hypothetical protein